MVWVEESMLTGSLTLNINRVFRLGFGVRLGWVSRGFYVSEEKKKYNRLENTDYNTTARVECFAFEC